MGDYYRDTRSLDTGSCCKGRRPTGDFSAYRCSAVMSCKGKPYNRVS